MWHSQVRNSTTNTKIQPLFNNQTSEKSTPVRLKSRIQQSEHLIKSIKQKRPSLLETNKSQTKTKVLKHQDFVLKKHQNKQFNKLASLITYAFKSADKALKYLDISCNFQAEFAVKLYLSDRQNLIREFNNLSPQTFKFSSLDQSQIKTSIIHRQSNFTNESKHLKNKDQKLKNKLSILENQVQIDKQNLHMQSRSSHNFFHRRQQSDLNTVLMTNSDQQEFSKGSFDFIEKQLQSISSLLKKIFNYSQIDQFLELNKKYSKWKIESINQQNNSNQRNSFLNLANAGQKRMQQLQELIVDKIQKIKSSFQLNEETQQENRALKQLILKMIVPIKPQIREVKSQQIDKIQQLFNNFIQSKQKDISILKHRVSQFKIYHQRLNSQIYSISKKLQQVTRQKDNETQMEKAQILGKNKQLLQQINQKESQINKLKQFVEDSTHYHLEEIRKLQTESSMKEENIIANSKLLHSYKTMNELITKALEQNQISLKEKCQKINKNQSLESQLIMKAKQIQEMYSQNQQITQKYLKLVQQNVSLLKNQVCLESSRIQNNNMKQKLKGLQQQLQILRNKQKITIKTFEENILKLEQQKVQLQSQFNQLKKILKTLQNNLATKEKQIKFLTQEKDIAVQNKKQQQELLKGTKLTLSNTINKMQDQLQKSKETIHQLQGFLSQSQEQKIIFKKNFDSEVQSLMKKISQFQSINKILCSQCNNMKSFLSDNRQKSKQTIHTLQQLIEHLKQQNSKMKNQNKQLIGQLNIKQTQISGKVNALTFERQSLIKQCDYLNRQNRLKQMHIESYQAAIEKVKTQLLQKEQMIIDKATIIKQKDIQIIELQLQVKKIQSTLQQNQQNIKELMSIIQSNQKKIQNLNRKIQSFSSKLQANYKQFRNLKYQFDNKQNDLTTQINKLITHSKQMFCKIQQNQNMNKQQQNEIQQLISIKVKLQEQIKLVSLQLNIKNQQVLSQSSQINVHINQLNFQKMQKMLKNKDLSQQNEELKQKIYLMQVQKKELVQKNFNLQRTAVDLSNTIQQLRRKQQQNKLFLINLQKQQQIIQHQLKQQQQTVFSQKLTINKLEEQRDINLNYVKAKSKDVNHLLIQFQQEKRRMENKVRRYQSILDESIQKLELCDHKANQFNVQIIKYREIIAQNQKKEFQLKIEISNLQTMHQEQLNKIIQLSKQINKKQQQMVSIFQGKKKTIAKYEQNQRTLIDQIIKHMQKIALLQNQIKILQTSLRNYQQTEENQNQIQKSDSTLRKKQKLQNFEDYIQQKMQNSFISVINSDSKQSQIFSKNDQILSKQSQSNLDQFEDFSSVRSNQIMQSVSSKRESIQQMSSQLSFYPTKFDQNNVPSLNCDQLLRNIKFPFKNLDQLQKKQTKYIQKSIQSESQFESFEKSEQNVEEYGLCAENLTKKRRNQVQNMGSICIQFKQFIIRNAPRQTLDL